LLKCGWVGWMDGEFVLLFYFYYKKECVECNPCLSAEFLRLSTGGNLEPGKEPGGEVQRKRCF
jgi:hypothetical protein